MNRQPHPEPGEAAKASLGGQVAASLLSLSGHGGGKSKWASPSLGPRFRLDKEGPPEPMWDGCGVGVLGAWGGSRGVITCALANLRDSGERSQTGLGGRSGAGTLLGECGGGSDHGRGLQTFAPKVTKCHRQGQPGSDWIPLQTHSSGLICAPLTEARKHFFKNLYCMGSGSTAGW